MQILILLILVWNISVFILYGADKIFAINGSRRISEKRLLAFAFLFGGIGAFAGMQCFRHKTKHLSFNISVPIAFVITIAAVIYLLQWGGNIN